MPSPAAGAVINGGLAQDVAGFGGYAMWNDHLYLGGTLYRSEHIGGPQPNPGTGLQFQHPRLGSLLAPGLADLDNQQQLGDRHLWNAHEEHPRRNQRVWKTATRDWAADFQFDRVIPQWKHDVLSFRGTYIRENSSLQASFAGAAASLVRTPSQHPSGQCRISLRHSSFRHRRVLRCNGNAGPSAFCPGSDFG